ncbi:SGM_3592 family protein [Streptomyces alkaliterrae]|uniref:SGM_3592 family protein n=1 Tax=Streptomyces alkaliterrae TaxID=2213162 RepID=UPI003F699794
MGSEPQGRGEEREPRREESTDWDGLVLDEDFIRSAEVSEPAARTRMLQERWRREPPEPQPWRADEPPAGWFFSKSRRKARRRRRRRED